MANTAVSKAGGSGSSIITLDTSDTDIPLTAGHGSTVSSVVLHISGLTADGGNITPRARLVGAAENSIGYEDIAYENLATGATVAVGTAITTDGLYVVRVDHGVELAIDYVHVAGPVVVLFKPGLG